MDFVWKLYGNTYAVHVTVALVGVATLDLALPAHLLLHAPLPSSDMLPLWPFNFKIMSRFYIFNCWADMILEFFRVFFFYGFLFICLFFTAITMKCADLRPKQNVHRLLETNIFSLILGPSTISTQLSLPLSKADATCILQTFNIVIRRYGKTW